MYFFIEKWKADPVKTVGIVPYIFFVLEAKPRDKKHIVGMISIRNFNEEHILNA